MCPVMIESIVFHIFVIIICLKPVIDYPWTGQIFQYFHTFGHCRSETAVESDGKFAGSTLFSGDNCLFLFRFFAHRLFAPDPFTGIEGFHDQFRMGILTGSDDYQIYFRITEQLLVIAGDIIRGKLFCMSRKLFRIQVCDRPDMDKVCFMGCRQMMGGNKSSRSDKTDIDNFLFHNVKYPIFVVMKIIYRKKIYIATLYFLENGVKNAYIIVKIVYYNREMVYETGSFDSA